MTKVGQYFLGLRRDTLPWLFILFFLGVVLMTGFYVLRPALQSSATLQLGDGVFTSTVVFVKQSQINTIVDAEQLSSTDAVILTYDYEQILPIVLRARDSAVDLIWLNNDKQVVYIVKNVSDRTVNTFTPVSPARYIVELTGGMVKNKSIAIGDKAIFHDQRAGGF